MDFICDSAIPAKHKLSSSHIGLDLASFLGPSHLGLNLLMLKMDSSNNIFNTKEACICEFKEGTFLCARPHYEIARTPIWLVLSGLVKNSGSILQIYKFGYAGQLSPSPMNFKVGWISLF